jgi:alanine dehydrogenase
MKLAGFEPDRPVGLKQCVDAIENALMAHAEGSAFGLSRRQITTPAGAFHVTSGGEGGLLSVKVNGHFSPLKEGQPTRLTGAILVFDAHAGEPQALLDSLMITLLRTAAMTVIAAAHLAPADAQTALLIGSGRQARGQVQALKLLSPKRLQVAGRSPEHVLDIVAFATSLGVETEQAQEISVAAQASDIIVTITRASSPVLAWRDVKPGALVIALGADSAGKQELDPKILAEGRVIVDVLGQAVQSGEVARAIEAGALRAGDVHAELSEVASGRKQARTHPEETVVFDSTGTGIQDVATAALVLDAARERGIGLEVDLASQRPVA